jgi:hypothetical protein
MPRNPSEILEILVSAGRITWGEIARITEMADLERRLKELKAAIGIRGGEVPVPHVRTSRRGPKLAKRRKGPVSAERRASQKLQGQYIAYLRQLPKSAHANFQKMAREDGREKAITAMKERLGK